MKKFFKKLISLICAIIIPFNVVGCQSLNIKDVVDDVGDWMEDAASNGGEWWGNTTDNVEEWWQNTSSSVKTWWDEKQPSLEAFWGNASSEINRWMQEAEELGVDIAEFMNQKFDEIAEQIRKAKNEIKDKTVTGLATSIYKNSQSANSGLSVSSRSFSEVDLSKIDLENLDDDVQKDFAYDTETFVYNLVKAMMPSTYETFVASMVDSEGNDYYGLAYTDYSKAYKDNFGKLYYTAGFVSLIGELSVPKAEINSGLEITPLDNAEEGLGFVYAYSPEDYRTHCVALGKYFIFGIQDKKVVYEVYDYTGSSCADESLGELYSFDQNKVVAFSGEESYFTASPVMAEISYQTRSLEQIKADLYADYESFKVNLADAFASLDVKAIYNTVKNKIVQLYNEMGFSSGRLANLTLNDVFGTDIFADKASQSASQKEKVIVGVSCATMVILTIACQLFVPQLKSIMGAVQGSTMEILTEVVLEDSSLSTLDYRKVAMSAVAGAISVNTGILVDSVIGGVTESAMAAIDGENLTNIAKIFFDGCLRGVAIALAFKGIGKVLSATIDGLAPNLRKNAANFISNHQLVIGGKSAKAVQGTLTETTTFSSKRVARKINKDLLDFEDVYYKEVNKQLPSIKERKFKYLDFDYNPSNKKLTNCYLEFDDMPEEVVNLSIDPFTGDKITRFRVTNGQVDFGRTKAIQVQIEGFSAKRYNAGGNMQKADKLAAEIWGENPDQIPKVFKDKFREFHPSWTTDADFIDLSADDIAKARSTKHLSWTWHEYGLDGTMMLVPTELHGKLSHMGAKATIELLQSYGNPRLTAYVLKYVLN